jgi:hypothetical protein
MERSQADQSESVARSILAHYADCMVSSLGESLEAVILCGSLATGSYVPGESDIDQITILRREAVPEAEAVVRKCREMAMHARGGGVNLADVVYRPEHLDRPWRTEWDVRPETKHLVTVPEELLRIHDHGQVIYSRGFQISDLPRPTIEEMVLYQARWRNWNAQYQEMHPEFTASVEEHPTPRVAAQSILSRAIWHYYFATGRTCFNKHRVAERLRCDVPRYLFQDAADLATRVRMRASRDVLEDELRALRSWFRAIREWCGAHPVEAVPSAP